MGPPEAPVNGHQNDGSEDCHHGDLGTPPNSPMEGGAGKNISNSICHFVPFCISLMIVFVAAATSPPIEGAVNPKPDKEPAPFCATSDGRVSLTFPPVL